MIDLITYRTYTFIYYFLILQTQTNMIHHFDKAIKYYSHPSISCLNRHRSESDSDNYAEHVKIKTQKALRQIPSTRKDLLKFKKKFIDNLNNHMLTEFDS